MTTSGTYTFSVSNADVVRESMINIGKLYEGEVPSAQDTTDITRKINMLCKQWQAKADFAPGLKVWTRLRGALFLSSTTGRYSLGSSATGWGSTYNQTTTSATRTATNTSIPITSATGFTSGDNVGICLDSGALFWTTATISGTTLTLAAGLPSQATAGATVFNYTTTQIRPEVIETAVLRDVNFNDIPLDIMTLQDYEFLPTKASPNYIADPQAIYYEYQNTSTLSGALYTDVGAAADTTKHLHIVFLSPVQDMVNPTDTFQYPQSWYLALSWGVAKQIAPMYNAPWSPLQEENYKEALMIAREQFPERTSLYFEPGREDDYRGNG